MTSSTSLRICYVEKMRQVKPLKVSMTMELHQGRKWQPGDVNVASTGRVLLRLIYLFDYEECSFRAQDGQAQSLRCRTSTANHANKAYRYL